MGKLTALGVKSAEAGRHGDGDGLYLLVKPSGARSWLLRIQRDGKRQDIGLGSVSFQPAPKDGAGQIGDDIPILQRRHLTLNEAREKAALLSKLAKAGRDPITERDKDRRKTPTFKEAAIAAHEALAPGWAKKHAASFLSSLEDHAYAALGELRIDAIEASHIRDMLAPIWTKFPVMARKVRQRTGTVLNFAKSKGWRATEAPGKSVTLGLARQGAGGNFAAMPYADVPAFVSEMREKPETAGRVALLLLIYTAARSGEVRATKRKHFDLERKEWNRPADIMKGKVAHTVTLSDAAVALLEAWFARHSLKPDNLVFSGAGGKMLSDMTMSKVMKDASMPYTPHGFRSSFRDWAAEMMPTIPDPVAEAALSHVVPDKVIAAYKRTQFLEMRRKLLDSWADYLGGGARVLRLVTAA